MCQKQPTSATCSRSSLKTLHSALPADFADLHATHGDAAVQDAAGGREVRRPADDLPRARVRDDADPGTLPVHHSRIRG